MIEKLVHERIYYTVRKKEPAHNWTFEPVAVTHYYDDGYFGDSDTTTMNKKGLLFETKKEAKAATKRFNDLVAEFANAQT